MDNEEVREFPGGPVVGILSFSAEDLSSLVRKLGPQT